ncbi:hypothetical protein AB1Y20_017904 [Prymnesium parvum]|uniref:FHA domain-containing protein n=1 Tax=Prymnesium parvum TaxID=97485 RepID=A0AB34JPR8_PRYPA
MASWYLKLVPDDPPRANAPVCPRLIPLAPHSTISVGRMVAGEPPPDHVLQSPRIGRLHARLSLAAPSDPPHLIDCASLNGCTVDHAPLPKGGRAPLSEGCVVVFGHPPDGFRYVLQREAARATPPQPPPRDAAAAHHPLAAAGARRLLEMGAPGGVGTERFLSALCAAFREAVEERDFLSILDAAEGEGSGGGGGGGAAEGERGLAAALLSEAVREFDGVEAKAGARGAKVVVVDDGARLAAAWEAARRIDRAREESAAAEEAAAAAGGGREEEEAEEATRRPRRRRSGEAGGGEEGGREAAAAGSEGETQEGGGGEAQGGGAAGRPSAFSRLVSHVKHAAAPLNPFAVFDEALSKNKPPRAPALTLPPPIHPTPPLFPLHLSTTTCLPTNHPFPPAPPSAAPSWKELSSVGERLLRSPPREEADEPPAAAKRTRAVRSPAAPHGKRTRGASASRLSPRAATRSV